MNVLGFFTLLATVAGFGTSAAPLVVVDERGAPIAGATVVFSDAAGARDAETSAADGSAAARAGFVPIGVDVARAGFATVHVDVRRAGSVRVSLVRELAVIGSVTVATGSARSAHESPLATSVLDRTTLALAPGASTDRILRELPGFDRTRSNSAFTNYGQLRASFSGAGTDRGVVLVDGFPAQDGFGGQIDWQAYPGDEIERAELLRGAGSALYGSGAVGGVLDLRTFGPQTGHDVAPNGRLSARAGTNDDRDESFAGRATLGRDVGVSLVATANRFSYRDLPPGYASPIDHDALSASAAENFRARFDDGTTTLDGSVLYSSDHQDEGRRNYTFDRTLRQEGAIATHRLGAALARFGYYVRDTTVYNLADLNPKSPGILRYDQHVPTDENGFFTSLTGTAGTTDLEILADQRRVDGQSVQNGATGALQAFGTGVSLAQGVGVQATFRARRAELVVGARADRVRYDDLTLTSSPNGVLAYRTVAGHDVGAVSPRAALRYDLTPRVALRVSSGGGFRAPYLNELVRGFNVGTVVMAPSPTLVPERSRTDVAGIDALIGTGRLSLDVTQTRVDEAIAFQTITPTLMRRANLDRTQTDGETLSYAQPIGPCTRVRVAGTTQNARVVSGPAAVLGKTLTLVPTSSASVGVDGSAAHGLGYALDASYVGQTYYDDVNTQPLGAALLVGATLRATGPSGTTLSLSGDNLTNQRYLSSIDRYGQPLTVAFRVGIPFGRAAVATRRGACAPAAP